MIKIIFWNKDEFNAKKRSHNPKSISWNFDVEFDSKNQTESLKTFSSQDLFSHDTYSCKNDSTVIGMKILINHIQLPSPLLTPKYLVL